LNRKEQKEAGVKSVDYMAMGDVGDRVLTQSRCPVSFYSGPTKPFYYAPPF